MQLNCNIFKSHYSGTLRMAISLIWSPQYFSAYIQIRHLYHGIRKPRVCKDNAPPKIIFWAKCGKVTFQDLVKFKSNHFIPLVEKHLLSTEFPGILLLKFGIGTVYRHLLIHFIYIY